MAKWGGRFDTVDFRQQGGDFVERKSMKQPRAVADLKETECCERIKISRGRGPGRRQDAVRGFRSSWLFAPSFRIGVACTCPAKSRWAMEPTTLTGESMH